MTIRRENQLPALQQIHCWHREIDPVLREVRSEFGGHVKGCQRKQTEAHQDQNIHNQRMGNVPSQG